MKAEAGGSDVPGGRRAAEARPPDAKHSRAHMRAARTAHVLRVYVAGRHHQLLVSWGLRVPVRGVAWRGAGVPGPAPRGQLPTWLASGESARCSARQAERKNRDDQRVDGHGTHAPRRQRVNCVDPEAEGAALALGRFPDGDCPWPCLGRRRSAHVPGGAARARRAAGGMGCPSPPAGG